MARMSLSEAKSFAVDMGWLVVKSVIGYEVDIETEHIVFANGWEFVSFVKEYKGEKISAKRNDLIIGDPSGKPTKNDYVDVKDEVFMGSILELEEELMSSEDLVRELFGE